MQGGRFSQGRFCRGPSKNPSQGGSHIAVDIATVLLQWAAGGLVFLWLTRRHSYVSRGYRWLLLGVWGSLSVVGLLIGILGDGFQQQGEIWVQILRLVAGGLFLGVVTDVMLLGHWYLVQPGMPRAPLLELVKWAGVLWLADVVVWLLPTGMLAVLSGGDDVASGSEILGWFWVVCVLASGGLLLFTRLSLKEPSYSAVMAATGLSYLAVMTAFAMELVPRLAIFG